MTYFFLILAIVAMAFMVMFRVRISPQTVITVQSALPKIIVALLLITFSYAIAGFLIDIMYIVIGLIASILAGSGLLSSGDFGTVFNELATRTALDFMFSYFLGFIIISLFVLFSNAISIIQLIGIGMAGSLAPSALLILLILIVIILIIMLVLTFKIWFMLIKSFVSVLLLTIVGPIQILLGVFGYGGFGGWVRNMASHLAVFPVAAVMFLVSFLFLGYAIPEGLGWIRTPLARILPFNPDPRVMGSTTDWIPPLTWGSGTPEILWLAVSVVIISLIPKTADIIKSLIQGRPFAYGSAMGEAIGPGMAAFGMGRRGFGMGRRIAEPELGYQAALAGKYLQSQEAQSRLGRLSGAGAAAGRGFMRYGEPRSDVYRDRDTGEIKEVYRKGTSPPKKP
jgi:hypothetical protein